MNFFVARQARKSIEDIFWRISADNPAAAEKWLLGLDRIIAQAAAFPFAGKVVREFNIPELRERLHGKYRVIYFCGAGKQTLTNVVHEARLLKLERDVRRPLNEDE